MVISIASHAIGPGIEPRPEYFLPLRAVSQFRSIALSDQHHHDGFLGLDPASCWTLLKSTDFCLAPPVCHDTTKMENRCCRCFPCGLGGSQSPTAAIDVESFHHPEECHGAGCHRRRSMDRAGRATRVYWMGQTRFNACWFPFGSFVPNECIGRRIVLVRRSMQRQRRMQVDYIMVLRSSLWSCCYPWKGKSDGSGSIQYLVSPC